MFLQKKDFSKSKHRLSIVSSESLDLDFVIIFPESLPKIVYFDEQLFVIYLFANNEQLISLTNNEYSRTNEKHNSLAVVYYNLLIKGTLSHKQRPQNLLEMFKFVEKQCLGYVSQNSL